MTSPDEKTLLKIIQGKKMIGYFVPQGTPLEDVILRLDGSTIKLPRLILDQCLAELDKDLAA